MAKSPHLSLETLEDRTAPAFLGAPWPEPDGLTLSFAPDGTLAGNHSSSLFQTLDAQLPTRAWQLEILRAFQTWAVEADVNVGLVSDGGQAFGTLGLKQGDPRFGDIRVGAYPMAADVLAVTDPYDPFVANTWVGDVFLNSTYPFDLGGAGSTYDLFSVMLHEAGHVFGQGDSDDPNSPMFENFRTVRTGLAAVDIAGLRSLYGARPPDDFEGPGGNDTFATATTVSLTDADGQPAAAALTADVTTLQDADVYRLAIPAGTSALDVRLQVAGLSLLVPRLTVYDASGKVVGGAVAADALENDVAVHLDHVTAGETYYVRVEGATGDAFGIGKYELDADPQAAAPQPASTVAPTAAVGPADLLGDATLLANRPGYIEHTYYEAKGALSEAAPAQTYRIRSADLGPDLTNIMTVVVEPLGTDARFGVTVLDDQGDRVETRLVPGTADDYAVQVSGVRSARDYYVQVSADNAGGDAGSAAYEVTVDFDQDATHLETFVSDTLGPDQVETLRTLQVVQSQQFHLQLSASDWSAPVATGVRMTIDDAGGRAVFTMAVADGATRSADVFLDPGLYTVRFTRAESGPVRTPVLFKLSGIGFSDPIGPQLQDTTLEPVESAAVSTVAVLSFYWLPFSPADRPGRDTPALASSRASQDGVLTTRNAGTGTPIATELRRAESAAASASPGALKDPRSVPTTALPPGIVAALLTGTIWVTERDETEVGLPGSWVAHGQTNLEPPTQLSAGPARSEYLPVVSPKRGDDMGALPSQLRVPERAVTSAAVEAHVNAQLQEPAASVLPAVRQVSAQQAGLKSTGYLVWALGLGGLALRLCRVSAKASFSREPPASAGPRSPEARG